MCVGARKLTLGRCEKFRIEKKKISEICEKLHGLLARIELTTPTLQDRRVHIYATSRSNGVDGNVPVQRIWES